MISAHGYVCHCHDCEPVEHDYSSGAWGGWSKKQCPTCGTEHTGYDVKCLTCEVREIAGMEPTEKVEK